MAQIKPFSVITETEIQDWKAKHGEKRVKQFDVEIPDEGTYSFFIAKPTRAVIDLVTDKNQKNDAVGANKALLANCVLGGDMDDLEADGEIYNKVIAEIAQWVVRRTEEIKN